MPRLAEHQPRYRRDVLRIPLLGKLLLWRWGRLAFQIPLLVLAILLIIDGFVGPDIASRNLATVGSWVHYRGLLVLVLLLAGNLFCMACPFTLPRTLAKRMSGCGQRFPRRLRNKWLAIVGLFGTFFIYEWLDLWSSPLLTAWVIVAYFVCSFALELFFVESAFCKYVCPLGAFNYVYSSASPTRIAVHDINVCRTCVGKECINGSYRQQPKVVVDQIGTDDTPERSTQHDKQGVLGCGTELFAPQMKSGMDCTVCLDCSRACPHENVGLFVQLPLRDLTITNMWRKRWDAMLLPVILAFMAITNAFGMVPPVYDLIEGIGDGLEFLMDAGVSSQMLEGAILLILMVAGNFLVPVVVTIVAAWGSRWLTHSQNRYSTREVVAAFAPAFVPLGFGIWTAHYLFHFLTGFWSIVPVFQEFWGFSPEYGLPSIAPDSPTLGAIETIALGLGFAGSLHLAQNASLRLFRRQAFNGLLPWALLFLLMTLAALWIMGLPMEMRSVDLLASLVHS